MRWKDKYSNYERPKRPKARKCSKEEIGQLLVQFLAAIKKSPVLDALGCTVTAQRGRFYVCQVDPRGSVQWGRITPLDESNTCILERPGRGTNWYEIATGKPSKLISAIANDVLGTFHGLGSINKFMMEINKGADPSTAPVKRTGTENKPKFIRSNGEPCPAQVALYYCFGVPISVLIEPRVWYARRRAPCIIEYTPDLTRVLVQFSAETLTASIIGTCLYLQHPPTTAVQPTAALDSGEWGAYTIRPSESESIAKAEAWIVKRKWNPW